ncbi:multicopper oxidase domain-containing protein [Brevibacillus sp. SYP-B805]|uniref:multicopper oxidase domain-containing protein n=1 Tax=Brevibacillus sp. SYP-B805 TaxID=1578199 RepID=UPI0013EA12A3|nr:multicopper oxidase domain-containing protein [Brevibacillus sp. SYP-B805]NGQ93849.1 multicopper oxidase domain-containing protein [Brevibacillus sp. SYP-B805]
MANEKIQRREILKMGMLGTLGALGAGILAPLERVFGSEQQAAAAVQTTMNHARMGHGYDPGNEITEGLKMAHRVLTEFDYGKASVLPNGQTLREYELVAAEQTVEVAKGLMFPGWAYNGRIPGPTIRCTEGDIIRVTFKNYTSHPHSIHFHGMHPTNMDGLEPVQPGGTFVYEFEAKPHGVHVYHCHVPPLAKHIHKGMYGNLIVDPRKPREKALELNMVMNGFDLDLDGENDVYTVNGYAFAYHNHPIQVKAGELVRIYVSNMTEFDLLNSFHLHANFFHYTPNGHDSNPRIFTDTISQIQGERGMLEIVFPQPGRYMFHAHQSEFAELGWMGFFEAK